MTVRFKKIFLLSICFLSISCSTHRYGAVFYDDACEWIKESFQEDNKTSDMPSVDNIPSNRTFLINNISSFNQTFIEETPFKADFNKNIYVVHTFTSVYRTQYYLTDLKLKSRCLSATYRRKNSLISFGSGNACQPYQRWFVVKLNRLEIDTVDVAEK